MLAGGILPSVLSAKCKSRFVSTPYFPETVRFINCLVCSSVRFILSVPRITVGFVGSYQIHPILADIVPSPVGGLDILKDVILAAGIAVLVGVLTTTCFGVLNSIVISLEGSLVSNLL